MVVLLLYNFRMILNSHRYRSWMPHGFNLLNVRETQEMLHLMQYLREAFRKAKYLEIIPPSLDYSSAFQLSRRDMQTQPIFSLQSNEGESLSVRSDLTIQVIKAAANGFLGECVASKEEASRFSYIQPVFLQKNWGYGLRREMYQAGVELLHGKDPHRAYELLCLAYKLSQSSLKRRLGASVNRGYSIKILYGDVRVVQELLSLAPSSIRQPLASAIYHKDIGKITELLSSDAMDQSVDLVRKEAVATPHLNPKDILKEFPLIFGCQEVIPKLQKLCEGLPHISNYLQEAKEITRDIPPENLIFDFSLVHGISYYTGPVFKAYIQTQNKKRIKDTIFTGGVYDTLFREFSQDHGAKAGGFAINLSLLLDLE